jgi:RNA polymerase sigma-70 factor (ECF subfamily)
VKPGARTATGPQRFSRTDDIAGENFLEEETVVADHLRLIFTSGEQLTRENLCAEAIRLATQVVELLPQEPEAQGLLALMLLIRARRDARVDEMGDLLTLPAQDRRRWNRPMLDEGLQLVTACIRQNRPGPYQIQAAINAVYRSAASSAATDWRHIVDALGLQRFYLFHSIRADLLRRLGRTSDAVLAYQEAIARTDNAVERRFLRRQLDGLLH